jgi:predicted sulfurtransferase
MSFFLFEHISTPSLVADSLRQSLSEQNFRGTVYVAPEVRFE